MLATYLARLVYSLIGILHPIGENGPADRSHQEINSFIWAKATQH